MIQQPYLPGHPSAARETAPCLFMSPVIERAHKLVDLTSGGIFPQGVSTYESKESDLWEVCEFLDDLVRQRPLPQCWVRVSFQDGRHVETLRGFPFGLLQQMLLGAPNVYFDVGVLRWVPTAGRGVSLKQLLMEHGDVLTGLLGDLGFNDEDVAVFQRVAELLSERTFTAVWYVGA